MQFAIVSMPLKRVAHVPMKKVTSKRKPALWTDPLPDACPFQQRRYLEARMTRIERNMQAVFEHVGLQPPLMEPDDEESSTRSWVDLDAKMVRGLNARMARIERHMQTLVDHTGF
ncbi:hypothetical protein M5689_013844 [Euphorbia peplus]|nr:hypothetical protein M5689_013844 [Euphorbia peplus]